MKKIVLGSAGVEVSACCLGAMDFGTKHGPEQSFLLLDTYCEAGGGFVDTANIYSFWAAGGKGGESETLLGEWMRERRNRGSMFVASKVGFGNDNIPHGLSAAVIIGECEKSLKRLRTDTIDLFYAHTDDRNTPLEETMGAFDKLVRDGKVRYVGASNYSAWRLAQAASVSGTRGLARYCCVQQRYSYLRPRAGASFLPQRAANGDLIDFCGSEQTCLLAYSPLLGGAYTNPDRPLHEKYRCADTEARLRMLKEIAGETGSTVNQVVLAWMLNSSPAVIPVMAASTEKQLSENLAAVEMSLTAEQMDRLNNAGA